MYRLCINREATNCLWQRNFKETYFESELSPYGLCLSAFHAIYPYYLTLTSGGWFRWVKPNDGVIVQCPNPKGALEMKIFLCDSDKKTVSVEVLQTRGECPRGYKKGDTFILSPEAFKFCPKALDAFIPYLNLLAKGKKLPWTDKDGKAILRCPHISCGKAEFIAENI